MIDTVAAAKAVWEARVLAQVEHWIDCTQGCPDRSCSDGAALREVEQAAWDAYYDARRVPAEIGGAP